MTAAKLPAPIRPVAYQLPAAAAALDISPSSFERLVKPHVRLIRRGKLVLVPAAELERWVDESAEYTIDRAA